MDIGAGLVKRFDEVADNDLPGRLRKQTENLKKLVLDAAANEERLELVSAHAERRAERTRDILSAHIPGLRNLLDKLVTEEAERKFLAEEGYLRKERKAKA